MEKKQKKRRLSSILIFILILSFNQNILFGEDVSSENELNKEFFLKFGEDFKETLFSPKDWRKSDFLKFSAVISTGLLFYACDQEIHDWMQDSRSPASDDISEVVTHFGHGAFLAGLIAALYASGEFSDNDDLRKTALLSLESWVTSGVIVLGLKFVTGRARPKTGEPKSSFHLFSTKSSFHSFPSGHASSAFAVATIIADQSEETFVDILAYSLATLVALSRIHNNKHWASDVFIGSAIGFFVAKKIYALNQNQNKEEFRIGFGFNKRSQSISFSLSF